MNPRILTLALVLALATPFAQAEAVHAPPLKAKSAAEKVDGSGSVVVDERRDERATGDFHIE